MIKIFLSVRNRFAITQKCLESIKEHTKSPYQIYIYNNQTNYLLEDHFKYMLKLYSKGLITQVTFGTDASVFNAFSKASACNMFGLQHEQDPNKDSYTFLLMLDNDIILTPGWDKYLTKAWEYVKRNKLNEIKIIGQLPGGIKSKIQNHKISEDINGAAGHLGGSGLWSVRPNFFTDVGLLDLRQLLNQHKRHDQLYWQLLHKATNGKPYIMGINKKLGIHCGKICGSVCNTLTRLRGKQLKNLDCIKFEESEKRIRSMRFKEFFDKIQNDKSLIADW